ncbi:MAG TPA: TlpA disulfide reductase family protein [Aestuariivirga sp.]
MNKTTLTALLAVVLVGLGIYLFTSPDGKVKIGPVAESGAGMAAYIAQATPKELPALSFADGMGVPKDNAVFKGKVTLLNLWATWCAPCRKEMPELAKLQRELGGADFQVIELSEDFKGYAPSWDFLKQVGAQNLTLYADAKGMALDALRAPGLPVTLLLDKDGREIGRLLGPAPWSSDEAKALIKTALTK